MIWSSPIISLEIFDPLGIVFQIPLMKANEVDSNNLQPNLGFCAFLCLALF
jgi:hypothetical protein